MEKKTINENKNNDLKYRDGLQNESTIIDDTAFTEEGQNNDTLEYFTE